MGGFFHFRVCGLGCLHTGLKIWKHGGGSHPTLPPCRYPGACCMRCLEEEASSLGCGDAPLLFHPCLFIYYYLFIDTLYLCSLSSYNLHARPSLPAPCPSISRIPVGRVCWHVAQSLLKYPSLPKIPPGTGNYLCWIRYYLCNSYRIPWNLPHPMPRGWHQCPPPVAHEVAAYIL